MKISPSDLTIHQESINSPGSNGRRPLSESVLFSMGADLNYLISNVGQVGDIKKSMLTEAQFQALRDNTWVLADGRSAIGTQFQALTGLTNVPDFRAYFCRMKDNGVGLDAHGDLPLGSNESDQLYVHGHASSLTDPGHAHIVPVVQLSGTPLTFGDTREAITITTGTTAPNTTGFNFSLGLTGGGEFNPKSVVVNFFIKINP